MEVTDEVIEFTQEKAARVSQHTTEQAVEKQEAPKRERGKPAAGRARRTKEEIAEDEAADAAEANAPVAQISTGEERVGPEDDAETEAQDKADEQAEVEETRKAPLTIDDVKALAVQYQQIFGAAAVQEDGPRLFQGALGNPPAEHPHWKFSILPTDAASLEKLEAAWRNAVENNPYKREKV